MLIRNSNELKTILLPKIKSAVKQTQEEAYTIIHRFVKQWYAEYSPTLYARTYQLFQSLVKSKIIETPNGYKAEVYFDLDKLDYYMKTLQNGEIVKNKNWNPKSKSIEEKALQNVAEYGYHILKGRKVHGTEIWNESLAILNKEAINILVNNLKSAGIPIK